MPPSGFSKPVVRGALQFIGGCYEDLLQEVRDGKHQDLESAIQHELAQIQQALERIDISPEGKLLDRKTGQPMQLR